MTQWKPYSPEWEIERIVQRIEAGENPAALSTSEQIVASILYDHPEWRPSPYIDLHAALERLGPWKDATLDFSKEHGLLRWQGSWSNAD